MYWEKKKTSMGLVQSVVSSLCGMFWYPSAWIQEHDRIKLMKIGRVFLTLRLHNKIFT